ncbi:grasp-with-spasm system SPASM domain peptide maturase [Psychroserpens sp. MEBiC05023]
MFESNNYLILFANCIPVKGPKRSVICDLQNNQYKYIPNDLYDILVRPKISLKSLLIEYENENESVLTEYVNFILEQGLGFLGTDKDLERLPHLNLEFNTPAYITNMILELNNNSKYLNKDVVSQIQTLGCKNVEIFIYDQLDIENVISILELFKKSIVKSIALYVKFNDQIDKSELERLSVRFMQLTLLVFHSSPENSVSELELLKVVYTSKIIKDFSHCGIINQTYFSANVEKFTESKNYNSCLYKKISIDVNGNVKNCPALPSEFGNISSTKLKDIVVNNKNFKKFWNITKDLISTCKDCEFRYMCTDCRAYVENTEDHYSKPLKCGYDPYTNKWEEWSTNTLKQEAIKHYGLQDLIKNND